MGIPAPETLVADAVTATEARLNGAAVPSISPVYDAHLSLYFKLGKTSPPDEQTITAVPASVTYPIYQNVPFSAMATNLSCGTEYYYQAFAATEDDSTGGEILNLTTLTCPPTISSINPTSGSTAGGTEVTIQGSNLCPRVTTINAQVTAQDVEYPQVTIGGSVCNVTSCSGPVLTGSVQAQNGHDSEIACTTGPRAAGTVDVVVTTEGGTGTLEDGFTYQAPPAPPNPIPTLSEWAQIVMMLAMIATSGLYGWRMKQR